MSSILKAQMKEYQNKKQSTSRHPANAMTFKHMASSRFLFKSHWYTYVSEFKSN